MEPKTKNWGKRIAIVVVILVLIFGGLYYLNIKKSTFHPYQTSGSFLLKAHQPTNPCGHPNSGQGLEVQGGQLNSNRICSDDECRRYVLLFDIYIKSRSYALLNKVFFFVALASGIAVIGWPVLTVMGKEQMGRWEWLRSATVQTGVTAMAALFFSLYSQYKEKQNFAESLMRHVAYSSKPFESVASRAIEEMARIDNGFIFSGILSDEKEELRPPADR